MQRASEAYVITHLHLERREEPVCSRTSLLYFMFEFPCIISLYYIKNQQDITLAVLFISNCKITVHVSDAFCVHHQEY